MRNLPILSAALLAGLTGAGVLLGGCAPRVAKLPLQVEDSTWMERGDAAYERAEYAQAAIYYRESARRGEQAAVAWFNFANAMVQLERPDDAIAAYHRSVEWAPRFLRAHQNLAALYQLRDDMVNAARHYLIAVEIDSADANSRYRLGELALQAHDLGEAAFWFEEANRVRDDDAATSGLVQVSLKAVDTSEAILYVEDFNTRKQSPKAWSMLLEGDLIQRRRLDFESHQNYLNASLSETMTRGWIRQARALRARGRSIEAASTLEEATRRFPEDGSLWSLIGQLRLEGGDPMGARDAFSRALRLGEVTGVHGLEGLARWHLQRGDSTALHAVRDSLGAP